MSFNTRQRPDQYTRADTFYDDEDDEVIETGRTWLRVTGWLLLVAIVALAGTLCVYADTPTTQPAQALRTAAAELEGTQAVMLAGSATIEQQAALITTLQTEANELRARIADLESALPPIPAPLPLAARVNLYAQPSYVSRFGRAQLWTDVSAFTATELTTFMATASRPPGGIGTYLSSCDVRDPGTNRRQPAECITSDKIPAAWRFPSNFVEPGRWTVNLRVPDAVRRLGDEIVAAAVARRTQYGLTLLYLDNVAHPDSGDRRFTWAERCASLEYIRAALPADIPLWVNVTLPPGLWPNIDLQRLGRCVNGVTFEIALHPSYRDAPYKVASVIADIRELARSGVGVAFSLARNPAWSDADYTREKQLAAALALLCRDEADWPIFAVPGSQPPENPPWASWADVAGQPQGRETCSAGIWRREFAGGVVEVHPAAGTGVFQPRD